MQKIQITEARKIAERIGANQVVVIAFGGDHFAVTSYGATKSLCAEVGKWSGQLVADLESGRLPSPSAARAARARASGEGSGAGGSPMPPRPAQAGGGLDEPTSGELARGTDSLRPLSAKTFNTKDIGFTLETSEETKRELADLDKHIRQGHAMGRGFLFD